MKPFADSGEPASRPIAAASHDMARMKASRMPAAASQSSGPAVGRKPIASATASTSSVEARLRAALAATCPASTAAPPTSIARSRSMIPLVMSWLTLTAVVAELKPAHRRITPGTT